MHEDGGGRLVLGWLAVIRPIAFTIAWIVADRQQEGYSPRREAISAPAARYPWIMITGFMLLGVAHCTGVVQPAFVTVLLLCIVIVGARLIRLSRIRPSDPAV